MQVNVYPGIFGNSLNVYLKDKVLVPCLEDGLVQKRKLEEFNKTRFLFLFLRMNENFTAPDLKNSFLITTKREFRLAMRIVDKVHFSVVLLPAEDAMKLAERIWPIELVSDLYSLRHYSFLGKWYELRKIISILWRPFAYNKID